MVAAVAVAGAVPAAGDTYLSLEGARAAVAEGGYLTLEAASQLVAKWQNKDGASVSLEWGLSRVHSSAPSCGCSLDQATKPASYPGRAAVELV